MSPARKASKKKRKTTSRKTAAKTKTARATKSRSKRRATKKSQRTITDYATAHENKESALVLDWFRLLARCRGAWLQHLWMNEGSIDGRTAVTHAELAGILADQDSVEAESEWVRNQEPVNRWASEASELRRQLNEFPNSQFNRLATVFGMDTTELDLLRLSAAVAFDPALARVCAYLQDHSGRTYLTEELAARLLGVDRASVWTPEMNVFRWELVQRRDVGVGEPQALFCDLQIRDWLLGKSTLDEALVGAGRIVDSNGVVLPEWPVDETVSWINESLKSEEPRRLRIIVVAPHGGGKRKFAAAVAAQLGTPLLAIDSDVIR